MKAVTATGVWGFKYPGANSRILAGFLFLSLLAHALAFCLFQIIYPPPVAIAPPPADVSLLDLSNPAYDGLRRWIDAQDPAFIYASRESVPEDLLASPYQPSYAGIRSTPKAVAAATPSVVSPPARDPLSIIGSAAAPAPMRENAAAPELSRVRFSGPLAGRGLDPGKEPTPDFSGASGAILEPARFLIGVTDKGEVRYAFLQSSSGDKAVDDQAEARLFQMRFLPDAASLTWGLASFFWGNDAYKR